METAFAAPRTDTSALLNGRVNPQGETLTYRFEYSADGGETWTALAPQVNTGEAREQVIVGEQLENLTPGATYSYRLKAENVAGPASPQGDVKTFTTRTSAEVQAVNPAFCANHDVRAKQHTDSYLPDCRGIELINNPDKGNQNVGLDPFNDFPATSDGNSALWQVASSAPGGNGASENTFLARRTAQGWRSNALAPPVAEQIGAGALPYVIEAATQTSRGSWRRCARSASA